MPIYENFDRTFSAGDLILLSEGEYSDYSVHPLVRALKDFSTVDMFGPWREQTKKGNWDSERVARLLIEGGYAEDVGYKELHIGAYGELDDKLVCLHPTTKLADMGNRGQWTVCSECNIRLS